MKKRFLCTLVVAGTLSTILTPSIYAESQQADMNMHIGEKENKVKNNELSQAFIDKVDPMIEISGDQFTISEQNLKTLSTEEQICVKNTLKEVNSGINSSKNREVQTNVNLRDKVVSQTVYQNDNSGFRSAPNKYVDINYTWWGASIYFSSKAITNLNDVFSFQSVAAGLGAGVAMEKFLAQNGLKVASKFLGPVALYGAGIGWGMSKVDQGNGVWLNCVLYVPATITPA